jgi:hypothetical protein
MDLFREEVTAECDSTQGGEHGTPASKEEPSGGNDRVAHNRLRF